MERGDNDRRFNKLGLFMRMIRNKNIGMAEWLQVYLLLNAKYDPNEPDERGSPPLVYAAKGGHTVLIRLILRKKYKANVNVVSSFHETPLSSACRKGHFAAAKVLLKNGANPNTIDKTEFSPLRWAAHSGNIKLVKLLLRFNARLTQDMVSDRHNAMILAEKNNHSKVLELLQQAYVKEKKAQLNEMEEYEMAYRASHPLEVAQEKEEHIKKNLSKKQQRRLAFQLGAYEKRIQAHVDRLRRCDVENNASLKMEGPKMIMTEHGVRQWQKADKMKWTQKVVSVQDRQTVTVDRIERLVKSLTQEEFDDEPLPSANNASSSYNNPKLDIMFHSLKDRRYRNF